MGSVLNTSLFLPFGRRGVQREAAEASLVQDLLCYERVWVLTDHMAAVGILHGIMGTDALIEAMESGSLKFVRDRYVIGWPQRTDGYGATPVLSIMGIKGRDGEPTFSTYRAGDLAVAALKGFGLPGATEQRIGKLADDNTMDFDWPPGSATNVADDVARARQELEVYRIAASKLQDFPISDEHFKRLIRDIGKPHSKLRLPKHIGVVSLELRSGEALLTASAPIDAAQLAMIHMSLSDRFLRALGAIEGPAVLHTEPIVEEILRARVAAVQPAGSANVNDVLRAESVSFPVLSAPGPLPYRQVLKARDTRAAIAFRKIVDARDSAGTQDLLPAYLEALNREVGQRWAVRIGRWLAAVAIGKAAGGAVGVDAGLFVADQIVDKLLRRFDARYYIDTTLRRIADPSEITIVTQP